VHCDLGYLGKNCAEKLSQYIAQPDLIIDTAIDHWLKQFDLHLFSFHLPISWAEKQRYFGHFSMHKEWAEPTIVTQ
jgi:hypothetical protein